MHFIEDHFIPGEGHNSSAQTTFLPDGQITCHQKNRNGNRLKGRLPVRPDANSDIPMSLACYLELCEKRNPVDHTHDAEQQLTAEPVHASALAASNDLRPRCSQPKANARTATSSKTSKNLIGSQSNTMTQPKHKATTKAKAKAKSPSMNHPVAQAMVHGNGNANASANAEAQDCVTSAVTSSGIPSGCASCCESGGHKDHSGSAEHASSKAPNSLSGRKARKPHSCSNAPDATSGSNASKTRSGSKAKKTSSGARAKTRLHRDSKPNGPEATAIPSDVQEKAIAMLLALAKEPAPAHSCIPAKTVSGEDCLLACSDGCDDSVTASRNNCDSSVGASIDCVFSSSPEGRSNDGLDDSCDGVAGADPAPVNDDYDSGHHPSASMPQDAHDADSHEHEPEHKQAQVHDHAESTALEQAQEEKQSCSADQVSGSSDSISVDDGSDSISVDAGHDSSEESADCAEHESRMDDSSPDEAAQPAADDADKSGDKSSLVDGAVCSDAPGEAQGCARGKYLTYEQHLASDPGRPNSTRKIFKGSERAVADSLYSLDIDSLMIHRSLQHLELAVDALEDGTASESELKMAGCCGTLARVLMEHCDHLASWPELSEALYQLLSDRSVLNAASFESSGDLARLCELAPGPEWQLHSGAAASGASDSCCTAAHYALSNLHSMADLGVDTSEYLETMLTRILTARHLPERRALFETLLHEINTRQSRHELKTDNYHPESGQPSAKATGCSHCGAAGRSGSSKLRNGTDADDCGGIVEAGLDADSALADQSGNAGNAAPEQAAPASSKSPARLPGSCDYDLINDDHAQSTADAAGLADNASDDGRSNEADAYSKPDAVAACAAACTADTALAGSGSGQHSSQYSQSSAPAGALYKSLLLNEGNIASLGDELCAHQDELSTDAGFSSCTDSQNAWAVTREQVKHAGACNETDKTTQPADRHSTGSNTGRTGSDGHERSECSSVTSHISKTNSKGKGQKHGKRQDHDHSQSAALLAANNDHADSAAERTLGGNSVSEIEVEGEVEFEGKSCCYQGKVSSMESAPCSTACTDTDCAAGADSGYGCNESSDSDCGSAIASSKGTFWWDEILGSRADSCRAQHSAEISVADGAGTGGKAERCSARAAGLIDDARDEQLIISSLIRAFNSSLGTEGGPHDKRARKVYKSALEEATLAACDVVHLNGVFSQPDNALECMLRACTASLSSRRAAAVISSNPGSGGAARKGVRRPGAVPADALATTTVPAETKADAKAKAHAQARNGTTGENGGTGTSGALSASSEAQSLSSASASSSPSTAAGHASGINAQAACSESMLAHAGLTCANDHDLSYYHESLSHGHGHDDTVAAAGSDESHYMNKTSATSSPAGLNHLAEGKCLTSRTFWQTIKSRKSRTRSRTGAYSHAQLTGSMTEAASGSSHSAAAPDGCAGSAAPAASACAAGHGFDGNEAGTCAGSDAGLGTATADSTGTWKKAGTDYADSQATGVHRLKSQHASAQPADACGCSSVAADSRKAGRTCSHGRSDARELQMLALALSMKGMTSEEVSYFLPRLACELPCGQVQHSWSGQVIHSADAHNKAWSHETAGYGSGTGTGGGADTSAWTGGSNMGMGMDSSMLRELLADNTISGQRRSMSAELTHPVSKMALDNMIRLYFAFHRDQGLLYSERYVLSCEGGESERMQSLIFADSFRQAGGLAMASISHEDGHITVTLNTVSATDDLPDLQVQTPQHLSTACTTEHDTDLQSKSHGRTRSKKRYQQHKQQRLQQKRQSGPCC